MDAVKEMVLDRIKNYIASMYNTMDHRRAYVFFVYTPPPPSISRLANFLSVIALVPTLHRKSPVLHPPILLVGARAGRPQAALAGKAFVRHRSRSNLGLSLYAKASMKLSFYIVVFPQHYDFTFIDKCYPTPRTCAIQAGLLD
ncbi:hypothetical protein PAXRUDRAFT_8386 [Paxillus rubicundulus Ve08.2h10]|uniref:Uncharacterized protein n=1 Tax=Paxillus rubicundulus Ve08.2h10 TaxID=930991 RepID=A0A0D0DX97_9AGAM|nr:hypothetical protein PAXRUDRAFT_8386 [Paxillus rubicundulus Ve08.2h10]